MTSHDYQIRNYFLVILSLAYHSVNRQLHCLTNSGNIFRQQTAANRFTRSAIPKSNATVFKFVTSSAVMFRQAAASNRRLTSSFRSSVLTRSTVPFRRPSEVTDALISRFVNYREFHIDVSGHDSAIVSVMKRLRDKLDPRGWWYLVFKFDEYNVLHVNTQKTLCRIRFKETDEGMCLCMQMPGVDYHDMKVSVEGDTLFCQGIRVTGSIHNFTFELPSKTYQPSDVKGKIENGVLWVIFTNLKKEETLAGSLQIIE